MLPKIKKNQKVIIKEARAFTGKNTKNTSIYCRKKEQHFFQILESTNTVPTVVEGFEDWENYYLIIQELPGIVLNSFMDKNTLILISENDKKLIYERLKKIATVIVETINCVKKIHTKGIIINDVKLDNFIFTNDYEIKCIDLEDAYTTNSPIDERMMINSEILTDETYTILDDYGQDLQKLGYMLMNVVSNSNHLLSLDRSGELTKKNFVQFCVFYKLPPEIFEIIYSLVGGSLPSDKLLNQLPLTLTQTATHQFYYPKFVNSYSIQSSGTFIDDGRVFLRL